MQMLRTEEILAAGLTDWRKLAVGLHARFGTEDFSAAARFVEAVGEVGEATGHWPEVRIGHGVVDLMLVSRDAVYRDKEGVDHQVTWVTRRDVELARRISQIAADSGLVARPDELTTIELALDTADPDTLAPVWAALLTGTGEAVGFGMPGKDVRDPSGRLPVLWFQDTDAHETPRQRFHVDVWVPPDVAEQRIAAAVAAGGIVVDDSEAPSYVVIADAEGNKACVCTLLSPAHESS